MLYLNIMNELAERLHCFSQGILYSLLRIAAHTLQDTAYPAARFIYVDAFYYLVPTMYGVV
jgi:hypothetical protein